jgi:two-component system, LytTR family, response regulator
MNRLDILVVDDEALARRGMRILLDETLDRPIVREASSGQEAVAAIRDRRPDMVFLDVHLGRMDGFGVIESFGRHTLPPVIFVTAHDRYAVRAFEAAAVDYLLKPVDPDRLRDAVARALRTTDRDDRVSLRRAMDSVLEALSTPGAAIAHSPATAGRIAVRSNGRTVFLDRAEIDWVESAGNYVRVHTRGVEEPLTHRSTLDAFADLLGEDFIRIRRSVLLRRAAVRMCEPVGDGSYTIVLDDRTVLTSSRYYRGDLAGLVGP